MDFNSESDNELFLFSQNSLNLNNNNNKNNNNNNNNLNNLNKIKEFISLTILLIKNWKGISLSS